MAMTVAVGDRSLVSRLGPRQEFVELVDGVVEEEVVGVTDAAGCSNEGGLDPIALGWYTED